MTVASRPRKIDALMDQASKALAETRYFEAERIALNALQLARQAREYGRMARIAMPLLEARRQRAQLAIDAAREAGGVTMVDGPVVAEEIVVEPGCYLIQPPQVGADARRLRLAGLEQEVPVLVVCREPLTMLRLCPIVAIAPGNTVRTKMDPPADPDAPDLEWFLEALEFLGDDAVDIIDPGLATHKRLDLILHHLDAVPDHEGLHHALVEICELSEREKIEAENAPPTPRRRSKKS